MSVEWSEHDEPFFREYNEKRPGETRSLERARRLLELWDLDKRLQVPLMTVVGSKGKGTAAIFAAASLTGSGYRVGLVTSPSLRSNRERVRVDGLAMTDAQYAAMAARLDAAIAQLGPRSDGYLSPTGAYTVAAMDELLRRDCDVIVLEEGLGGASDEVSLFDPKVVAVTPIFEEHIGLLGSSTEAIAEDLLGVVSSPTTEVIVSVPQEPAVERVLQLAAATAGARLEWAAAGYEQMLGHARGLAAANARVGLQAAEQLLSLMGRRSAPEAAPVVASIRLPGRLTDVRRSGVHWVVDAAIEANGARAALTWCSEHVGSPDVVLLGLPDIKAVGATLAVFDGQKVLGARAGETHLTYDSPDWTVPLLPWREAVDEALSAGPRVVLAVGTISFTAEMLAYLDVDCDRVYMRGRGRGR